MYREIILPDNIMDKIFNLFKGYEFVCYDGNMLFYRQEKRLVYESESETAKGIRYFLSCFGYIDSPIEEIELDILDVENNDWEKENNLVPKTPVFQSK